MERLESKQQNTKNFDEGIYKVTTADDFVRVGPVLPP